MNNKIEDILLYNTIGFPSIDDLTNMPSDSMFEYINSTYCNGIVNLIKNKSAFMIARYTIEENVDCYSFELNDDDDCLSHYFKNIDEIKNISDADWFHTNYRKFCEDDVIITGESESYYYFIWFDNDVSDCSVAKLKKEHFNSISEFEMETVKYFNHIGYKINPIRKPNGWIKW